MQLRVRVRDQSLSLGIETKGSLCFVQSDVTKKALIFLQKSPKITLILPKKP